MTKLKYKKVPKPGAPVVEIPMPVTEVMPKKAITPERPCLLPDKPLKMPPGTPAPMLVRIKSAKGFLRAWYKENIGMEIEVGLVNAEGHHPVWEDITNPAAFAAHLIDSMDVEVIRP
jgi:hypothetical protein